MNPRTFKKLTVVTVIFIFCQIVFAQEYTFSYKGEDHAAIKKFMELRAKMQGRLRSQEKSKIEFSIAEYYYRVKSMSDAKRAFEAFAEKEKIDMSNLLANVYLIKIAQYSHQDDQIEIIKKRVFQDQFILLFEKYKTLKYVSSFDNEYTIQYFVDKIDIYLNGQLFHAVTP